MNTKGGSTQQKRREARLVQLMPSHIAMRTAYTGSPGKKRTTVFLSGLLLISIITLLLLPGPGQVRSFGSTARNLFTITESDYFSPLLSTAKAVTVLNCAAQQVAHFAGYDDFTTRVDISNKTQIATMTRYSGGLFSVLNIQFLQVEPHSNGAPVIYISKSFWDRAFGRDQNIVGTELKLHEVTYRIAGVTQDSEGLLATTDIWVPVSGRSLYGSMSCMRIVGTLRAGMDWANAQSELAKCFSQYLQDQPWSMAPGARLLPIESSIYFREFVPAVASTTARAASSRT